ncbi:KEOPS complex subunit Pcc1 [Archaeoglobus sp.]
MRLNAEFVFELPDAEILYRALKVEERNVLTETQIDLIDGKLVIRVKAEDLAELRASVNAWLRTVKACLDVL